ncbi:MAG: PH domain-containing protein [Actinomycetota bacterium]|nr:PH domain-containing protein [Actinomycetota bacterium]
MAYPDGLLGAGEQVVVHRHPHWKMLVVPVLALLLLVALCSYLAALVAGQSWERYAWAVLVAVGAVGVGWLTVAPLLRWRTTHFVLTTHRVLVREGVLIRSGIDIPLGQVEGVRFRHTLLERMVGCGTLSIESGSEEPLELDDIPAVERVHSLLHQQLHPDGAYRPPEWQR